MIASQALKECQEENTDVVHHGAKGKDLEGLRVLFSVAPGAIGQTMCIALSRFSLTPNLFP